MNYFLNQKEYYIFIFIEYFRHCNKREEATWILQNFWTQHLRNFLAKCTNEKIFKWKNARNQMKKPPKTATTNATMEKKTYEMTKEVVVPSIVCKANVRRLLCHNVLKSTFAGTNARCSEPPLVPTKTCLGLVIGENHFPLLFRILSHVRWSVSSSSYEYLWKWLCKLPDVVLLKIQIFRFLQLNRLLLIGNIYIKI